jgi:phage FluMu gp28-like protein
VAITSTDTTPKINYRRPNLYPKQQDAIFCSERYGIIEGSTKCGKTVACIAWLLEQAMNGKPGHSFWWISPVYPQAKVAFRRLKRGINEKLYTANESELTITLVNGSVISFRSAEKPDNLYGEDVYAAVMDEASRMREEAWHAIRSTLTATRGPVRIIGNVKGRRNWAYRMARVAEGGEPNWLYSRLTAADAIDAGIIDANEIEQAKRQLPEAVFKELYFAEPSDDGGNPFGQEAIRKCIGDISSNPPVIYGVDLAKSVDWTVAIGLDENGAVCRLDRYQLPWEETVRKLAHEIGSVSAIVDSTGVGDPIVERLQRELSNVEGYNFSSSSKQKLMEGLAVAIQSSEVRYPQGVIVSELDIFTYEYTRTGVRYSAPNGMHDDCVMALALAVYGRTGAAGVGVW